MLSHAVHGNRFTPRDLFRGGVGGLWLDFSDQSQIFSDAGSTIITDTGAIQQINDKSGNGKNMSQATAGSRPAWSASGFATFDGTADYLTLGAGLGAYAAAACSVFVLVKANAGVDDVIVAEASTASGSPWYLILYANGTTASTQNVAIRNDAASAILSPTALTTGVLDNTKRVIGVTDNGSSIVPYSRTTQGTAVPYTRSGALTNNELSVGAFVRTSVSGHMAMDLYQVVICLKVLTPVEIRSLCDFFDRK